MAKMDYLFDTGPLEEIHKEWKNCRKCELCYSRENIVFGDGSQDSEVVVVGQYPGVNDDKNSKPFSGPQGIICRHTLYKYGLREDKTFWTNVLMCSPYGLDSIMKGWLDTCRPRLCAEIESIRPKLVIAMGLYACRAFGIKGKMEEIHGSTGSYLGIPVLAMYHIAAIARARNEMQKENIKNMVLSDIYRMQKILAIT